MSSQALDLRRSAQNVRRHKKIALSAATLGLIAGAVFTVLHPPMVASTALVALPPEQALDIQTQAVVASSAPVLAGAIGHVDPTVSLETLQGRVRVTGVTSDVLEIDALGMTAAQATDTANAVAKSYIFYIRSPGIPDAWVLEPATSAAGTPLPMRLLVDGGLGALLGLLAGAIAALAVGRNNRRLRRRDEIADATGVPVLASIPVGHPTDAAGWRKLVEGYQPEAAEAWSLRKAMDQLRPTGTRGPTGNSVTSVAVVSLSSDREALALGPQLAAFAASTGISAALVIDSGHDGKATAMLRAACAAAPTISLGRSGDVLITSGGDQEDLDGQPGVTLTVVVAVVDGLAPRVTDTMRATLTVLGVSAGAATAEQLARVAVSAADDGRDVAGIIIADPDPADYTTGRLPQPGRPTQQRLPSRLAGIATEVRR